MFIKKLTCPVPLLQGRNTLKWQRIGYKVVALAQFGTDGAFTYFLEKSL